MSINHKSVDVFGCAQFVHKQRQIRSRNYSLYGDVYWVNHYVSRKTSTYASNQNPCCAVHRCMDHHWWHTRRCDEARRPGRERLRPERLHSEPDCGNRNGNMGNYSQQRRFGASRGTMNTLGVCLSSFKSHPSLHSVLHLHFCRVAFQHTTQWTSRARADSPAWITTTPTSCWWTMALRGIMV